MEAFEAEAGAIQSHMNMRRATMQDETASAPIIAAARNKLYDEWSEEERHYMIGKCLLDAKYFDLHREYVKLSVSRFINNAKKAANAEAKEIAEKTLTLQQLLEERLRDLEFGSSD